MYSVSNEYSRAIVSDTREMPYRVTLAGAITLDQSKIPNMTLNESASGTSGVSIGTANSASLKLTLRDAEAIDYNDILVEPESGLVLPDGRIEWVPLGKFWVTNSSTSNDYKTVTLTCADGMYHLTGEYESELTYPTTVKAVVGEICAKNGIAFAGLNSLPDITVRRKPEGLTYRDAIGYAAGCCGKNARFNRQGNLEFFWYEDTGITIERKTQYLNGMTKLNDKPLKVGFEVKGQQEIYEITIVSGGNGSVVATPGSNVLEGDTIVLSVNPFSGYELASIIATAESGASVTLYKNAEDGYTFIQPDSNVTITASFGTSEGAEDYYYEVITSGNVGQVRVCHGDTDLTAEDVRGEAQTGTIVSVEILPNSGYAFDYFDSNVQLTQVGTNKYNFIMPENDVSITVHFKFSENENDAGLYSWLQKPQAPPTAKPYWFVFYFEDMFRPTCQKYRLVWFDSWSVVSYTDVGDMREYEVKVDGYYFCDSKNKGHGAHEWDTSSWYGNGASSSSITARGYVDRMVADWDEYYGPSERFCPIAGNVSLLHNGSVVFEKCENAIGEVQIPYVQDGMDVREKGSLTQFLCPDTFSTPAPGANWMVLMPDSGLYMTVNADGKYETPVSSYPKSLIAFYYDSITIQNLGALFVNTDEPMYVASFTNGRWTYLRKSNFGWDEEIHELPEGAVIGFRSPLVSTSATDGYLDGNYYNFAGVLATSQTLYDTDGNLFMYNNACRICECASATTTFSLRRTASVGADYIEAKSITKTYTNPFIYEKAVSDISALVQEVAYTPAKVKHRGNPAFQVGDIVTVPDKDGVNHSVLIMQQTMTFGGGMNSEITCPGQTEQQASFSANGPITTQIKNEVKQSTADIERRVTANNALALASFQKSIGNTEAKIKSIVEWQTEKSATIARLEQTANDQGAKIALVVGQNGIVNENGAVQGSIVIEAINGESTAKISADRLDIEGKTLNIKVDATNITGQLTAEQINADGIEASDVKISGELRSVKGNIGGFEISDYGFVASTPDGVVELKNGAYATLTFDTYDSNGNFDYGISMNSLGFDIYKRSSDFSGGWFTLTNGTHAYILKLDHATGTVKFTTMEL